MQTGNTHCHHVRADGCCSRAHSGALYIHAGDTTDELFSAPKVQLINLLNKHLTNAPSGNSSPCQIMGSMAMAVAAIVCFAEHIASSGTCMEEATRLAAEREAQQAQRAQRRAQRVEERRAEKQARAGPSGADGLEDAADLEDSDVDEDDVAASDETGAASQLLPAFALSKIMLDWIETHQSSRGVYAKLVQALQCLTTDCGSANTALAWGLEQV